MPAKRPPAPGTLAFYAECGAPVFIVCNNFGRFARPNYLVMAQKVGWGAMAADIGKRLFCNRCKQRGAHFTLSRPQGRID